MKTDISVVNNNSKFEIDTVFWEDISLSIFSSVVDLTLDKINIPNFENYNINFDILFIDNAQIQEINAEYRKKNSPTDVITFALFFDSEDKLINGNNIELGEILISLDKAKTQAEENNVEFFEEIKTLIAHGILHLLGFDHLTEDDYKFVVDIQNKVIEKLNFE